MNGRLRPGSPHATCTCPSHSMSRPLRVSPQYRAVSLEKLVRKFGQPAAARDVLMVPVYLKCSLTSPSSRPVSGAYRVDSGVNSPVKWPGDPTDRVVIGPSALACYSAMRGLWRTRVTMTGGRRHSDHDVPSRRRHVSPSRSAHRFLPFRVALLSPCPPPCGAVSQGNWLVNSVNPPSPRGTPGRGRALPILPLILPRTGVRGKIRGEFTG